MYFEKLDIQILEPSKHLTEGFKAMKFSLIIFLIGALINFASGITYTTAGLGCLYLLFFVIWIFFIYKSLRELYKASYAIKDYEKYKSVLNLSKLFFVLSIIFLIVGTTVLYAGIDNLASSAVESTHNNREAFIALFNGLEPLLFLALALSGVFNILIGLVYYFPLKMFKNYSLVKIGMLIILVLSILMMVVGMYDSHVLISNAIANLPNTNDLNELTKYFKSVIIHTNLVYISNLIYLGSVVGLLFFLKAEKEIEEKVIFAQASSEEI